MRLGRADVGVDKLRASVEYEVLIWQIPARNASSAQSSEPDMKNTPMAKISTIKNKSSAHQSMNLAKS
jgi:hypothetical protein